VAEGPVAAISPTHKRHVPGPASRPSANTTEDLRILMSSHGGRKANEAIGLDGQTTPAPGRAPSPRPQLLLQTISSSLLAQVTNPPGRRHSREELIMSMETTVGPEFKTCWKAHARSRAGRSKSLQGPPILKNEEPGQAVGNWRPPRAGAFKSVTLGDSCSIRKRGRGARALGGGP